MILWYKAKKLNPSRIPAFMEKLVFLSESGADDFLENVMDFENEEEIEAWIKKQENIS